MSGSNKEKVKSTFSKRLKEIRIKRNFSQEELAEGISSKASIYSYEKDTKNPSLCTAKELANKLGVSIDWLCGNETELKDPRVSVAKAFLIILEDCKPEISIENGYAELRFKENDPDNSSFTIMKFFEKYSHIKEAKSKNILTNEMIQVLEDNLMKKYKNLPELLPYSEVK